MFGLIDKSTMDGKLKVLESKIETCERKIDFCEGDIREGKKRVEKFGASTLAKFSSFDRRLNEATKSTEELVERINGLSETVCSLNGALACVLQHGGFSQKTVSAISKAVSDKVAEIKKNVGPEIRRKRKELGMTQRKFADAVGVTQETISQWERGACLPGLRNTKKLLKMFVTTTPPGEATGREQEWWEDEAILKNFCLDPGRQDPGAERRKDHDK